MSLWNLLDPIYSGLERASDRFLPNPRKRGKDALDYLVDEIEDLKQKKESIDEALKGPQTGLNPAPAVGEGKILVADEGIQALKKRRKLTYAESMKKLGRFADTEVYSLDEEDYWKQYQSGKGGATLNIYGMLDDKKRRRDDIYEQFFSRSGKKEAIVWVGDYEKYERGEITYDQLIAGAYASYQELADFKKSMILEYRRQHRISPDVDIPLF